jgi:hypothetical protein
MGIEGCVEPIDGGAKVTGHEGGVVGIGIGAAKAGDLVRGDDGDEGDEESIGELAGKEGCGEEYGDFAEETEGDGVMLEAMIEQGGEEDA